MQEDSHGRFADAEAWIAEILGDAGLRSGSRAALCTLEIAALVAQRKMETVPVKLHELVDLISAQPPPFPVGWNWAGTVHFVQTDEHIAPFGGWLLSLFEALQGKDRAAVLEGVQTVAASFTTAARQ